MRKNLLLFASLLLTGMSVNGQNLLTGGDFEVEALTDITGWWSTDNGGKTVYGLTEDPADVFAGEKSMHVNVSEKGENAWDAQRVMEGIILDSASYGRFTVYLKGTAGTTMNFHLQAGGADWVAKWGHPLTSKWEKLTLMAYHEKSDTIRVAMHFAAVAGDYYVDNISLINSPIAGSTVVPTGDSIIIETGWALKTINSETFINSTFTVKTNGIDNPVTKVANAGKNKLALIPKNKIDRGDSVKVSYDGFGDIIYSTAGLPNPVLVKFSDDIATNNAITKTAIRDLKQEISFTVFPNPVENDLKFTGNQYNKITISNISGQQVTTFNNITGNSINVKSLPQGLYMISAFTKDGYMQTTKFHKRQ